MRMGEDPFACLYLRMGSSQASQQRENRRFSRLRPSGLICVLFFWRESEGGPLKLLNLQE